MQCGVAVMQCDGCIVRVLCGVVQCGLLVVASCCVVLCGGDGDGAGGEMWCSVVCRVVLVV